MHLLTFKKSESRKVVLHPKQAGCVFLSSLVLGLYILPRPRHTCGFECVTANLEEKFQMLRHDLEADLWTCGRSPGSQR